MSLAAWVDLCAWAPTVRDMEMEITLPEEMAVMTLPELTLFPQALLPLHIFETRYKTMLADALSSHRLFAVAALALEADPTLPEPPAPVATLGLIRACQQSTDGTSNLLIQGLVRVKLGAIVREDPYRLIRIHPLTSNAGAAPAENVKLRRQLGRLLLTKQRLSGHSSGQLTRFLREIDDPEIFVDVAAFNLCEDQQLRQTLLETLNLNTRLRLFSEHLRRDIISLQLAKRLQGRLADDDISNN